MLKPLETFQIQWYYNNTKGKHPLQSGCSEFKLRNVLTDIAYPVGRQDRHFYFRLLFLLSRKASNATIKLPKDISNANIPMKIDMISKAVIGATSLPMYSGTPVFINSGGYHPIMGTFRRCIVTRRYMNGYQFFRLLTGIMIPTQNPVFIK